jgi:hypothetical protein
MSRFATNKIALDMLFQKDEIALRRMQDDMSDYQLMPKWLTEI